MKLRVVEILYSSRPQPGDFREVLTDKQCNPYVADKVKFFKNNIRV